MPRILFVTENLTARKPLKSALLDHGYAVTVMEPARLGSERESSPNADVLVVDLEGSRVESHRLAHLIKRDRALKDVPMVLLVTEEQLGKLDFTWGADDYLTLPVSPTRLVQRLRFLLWKLNKAAPNNGLKIGELSIDFERYEVHLNGAPIDLTYKEFELLRFLASHPGRVFTREALLDKVWGYDFYGGTRTVDVHIRRLRSKIESSGSLYIQTVRNVGYKFIADAD